MGASIQSAMIAGVDVGAVLVDITPHSLGIRCLDYDDGIEFPFRFAPIIHRNSALPASRSEAFSTVHDNQTQVEIDVYQGESDDIRNNHNIGKFRIEGLGRVPAGNQITVQLDLDLNGILKVTARERATGVQKHITIENALARFESQEREQARRRLAELWDEAETDFDLDDELADDTELDTGDMGDEQMPELAPGPREGQREAVQARALLEKAERLLGNVAPQDRGDIEKLMANVRAALTDRRWDQVGAASNELADVLFYLEDA
jgi:molecular chaperone DnaK